MSYTLCSVCRICGNTDVYPIVDLGTQSLTSVFPLQDEPSPPSAPQVLIKCNDNDNPSACGLVQMQHTVDSSELYTDNYGYRSGLNATMINHLTGIVNQLESFVSLNPGDIVLDIGANDATLLSKYTNQQITRLGIDPTGLQFKQYYPENVQLVPTFFNRQSFVTAMGEHAKAKIVTTISMFYDLPCPQVFTNDVASILADDGVWLMEQSYLPTMIENLSFDTICHEHLEYYTLKQIEHLANAANLRVIDVSFNDCNGGSFRVMLCHTHGPYSSNIQALEKVRLLEHNAGWHTRAPYDKFKEDVDLQRRALVTFLQQQKQDGKVIAIYGASTKGNTLLQYYGIDNTLITCVAERNPQKYGRKTPGSEIPIMSEDQVRNLQPDYMLVLPWHFKSEFLKREQLYLDQGGTFIFPLPCVEIISHHKKTALVIGASGQVGIYMTKLLLDKGYRVYAMSRNPKPAQHKMLVNIPCDVTCFDLIDAYIKAIKPDEIYNFAAVTDSLLSIAQPVYTHTLNATLVVQITNTIKQLDKKIKFFQAGSTEIFKGHPTETNVTEDSLESLFPKTPYAVAKLASFWTVKNARDLDGMFAITGICSNIESKLRRSSYITKKIINYCKAGMFDSPLSIGNANAMCDWIHANDVTNAIYTVMHQPIAQDYIISSGGLHSVAEFASEVVRQLGVDAKWDIGYNELKTTNGIVLIKANDPMFIRSFAYNEMMIFNNTKLSSLYKIVYTLPDIVKDMLS